MTRGRGANEAMKAEIIAVGSELLTPDRIDTNSLYLTRKLNEAGFTVHLKCGAYGASSTAAGCGGACG